MLGRKQSISNDEWVKTYANIENIISQAEVDAIAEKTLLEIANRVKGKNVGYGWSGGKDSVVLSDLCEKAGVTQCIIGLCDLEYPAFLRWIAKHAPQNLEYYKVGYDLEWLSKHQGLLFPPLSYHYSRIIQIPAQNKLYKSHGLDMILLGRRKADGNYVGAGVNYYTDGKGRTKYNPLSDWTHEQVLGYIHYHNLPMAPFYEWKNGFKIGTHPWYTRSYIDNVMDGWQEIYDIDKTIVIEAAKYIDSAARFLQGVM